MKRRKAYKLSIFQYLTKLTNPKEKKKHVFYKANYI